MPTYLKLCRLLALPDIADKEAVTLLENVVTRDWVPHEASALSLVYVGDKPLPRWPGSNHQWKNFRVKGWIAPCPPALRTALGSSNVRAEVGTSGGRSTCC